MQQPQLGRAEVPKHDPWHPLDRRIQRLEEIQTLRRDSDFHDPPVGAGANPVDQAAALQAIQQPRDVRVPRDHPLNDFAASQTRRVSAPQDAQGVVLADRHIDRLQVATAVSPDDATQVCYCVAGNVSERAVAGNREVRRTGRFISADAL